MAQKKKKHNHGKPHGHYCKICGEYKSNEKFSASKKFEIKKWRKSNQNACS